MTDTKKTPSRATHRKNIVDQMESKSIVARLLARENITITRGDYQTAFFDLKDRSLGLPFIADSSPECTDLMIGHEVGHALHSKLEDFEKLRKNDPKSTVLFNIIEDIRVEKKIQSEFPGLISIFRVGYNQLVEKKFFGDSSDFASGKFLDRLNIFAKTSIPLPFSDEEQKLVDLSMAVDTHQDVLNVIEKIKDFLKSQKKEIPPETKSENKDEDETKSENKDEDETQDEDKGETNTASAEDESNDEDKDEDAGPSTPPTEDESNDEDKDESESESNTSQQTDDSTDDDGSTAESADPSKQDEDASDDDDSTDDTSTAPGLGSEGENIDSELESDSVSEFDKKMEENTILPSDGGFQIFSEPDNADLDARVIDYAMVEDQENVALTRLGDSDQSFIDFQKANKKLVLTLKNEFERKKSAFQYARSSETRRGTLNVNKMYAHKYDDNIFQTVTNLANSKSHSMLFMIDLSGSMIYNNKITEIYNQTLILAAFCKASGIPFEIYGWTTGTYPKDVAERDPEDQKTRIDFGSTKIVTLLKSDMSKETYKRAYKRMFISGLSFRKLGYGLSKAETMGGTPTLETLIVTTRIAQKFQKKHSSQFLNIMILSDGAGSTLDFSSNNFRTTSSFGKIAGKQVEIPRGFKRALPVLQLHLKAVTRAKLITFDLIDSPSVARSTYHRRGNLTSAVTNEIMPTLKKKGMMAINNYQGADRHFIVLANSHNLSSTNSFADNNTEGFSTSKLKTAFIRESKKKLGERNFVTSFIDIIS